MKILAHIQIFLLPRVQWRTKQLKRHKERSCLKQTCVSAHIWPHQKLKNKHIPFTSPHANFKLRLSPQRYSDIVQNHRTVKMTEMTANQNFNVCLCVLYRYIRFFFFNVTQRLFHTHRGRLIVCLNVSKDKLCYFFIAGKLNVCSVLPTI